MLGNINQRYYVGVWEGYAVIFLPPVLNARLAAEVILGGRIKSERGFAAIFYPLELRPHVICPVCFHKVYAECVRTCVA